MAFSFGLVSGLVGSWSDVLITTCLAWPRPKMIPSSNTNHSWHLTAMCSHELTGAYSDTTERRNDQIHILHTR
ncbi:hypothetical protein K445DRAFT_352517, partial [Daldinia sp. EC12]